MSFITHLLAVNRRNLSTLLKSPASEISGALGDLGTFLPITLALALQGSISLPSTLVTSGIFNILTGTAFGLPLPIQPMKAIAAAVLSHPSPSPPSPQASGLLLSLVLLFLSLTGLLAHAKRIPSSLISGIQLGTGLSLVTSASPLLLSNAVVSLVAFVPFVVTVRYPFPYALLAVIVSLVWILPGHTPPFKPWTPTFAIPSFGDVEGVVGNAIAQLPLTLLNSVLAVAVLGEQLTGESVSVTGLGVSVGLMNVVGAWVGAMPVCHGSGGLAAQWRFGARSGGSVVVLGVVKVLVGGLWGEGLGTLLGRFPRGVLGVMVAAAGVELAGRGLEGYTAGEEGVVVLTTAAGMVATRNVAVGFVVGVVVWVALRWKREEDELDGERRGLLAGAGA